VKVLAYLKKYKYKYYFLTCHFLFLWNEKIVCIITTLGFHSCL
jgi:hypothetical protein